MTLAVGDKVQVVAVLEPAFNGATGEIVEYSVNDYGPVPYVVRLNNFSAHAGAPEYCLVRKSW